MFLSKKTALYLRISKEDEQKIDNSQSIINQQNYLMKYADENKFSIVKIYIDDGFSGLNFERPSFKNMLDDIKENKIDTIITKDLSRLGRDYISTGYYIEKFFPSNNIRYIALNDQIDTGNSQHSSNDIAAFKSVLNDMYAKDISQKVRSSLMMKKINGEFIGSRAPYGYSKNFYDKNKLEIDCNKARNVRMIFSMFQEGKSKREIAQYLNTNGVLSPKNMENGWNASNISMILKNKTYTGSITQNKSIKISYKMKKRIALPSEKWITVENTHHAIIPIDIFNEVQNIQNQSIKKKKEKHSLSGKVFCDECGYKMTFIKRGKSTYLVCSNWKLNSKNCKSHCINDKIVNDFLFSYEKKINSTDKIIICKDKKIKIYKKEHLVIEY